MLRLLSCASAAAALTILTACGNDAPGSSVAASPAAARLTAAQAHPAAPRAAGTLAAIADVPQARERIGYVNAAALTALDGPLSAAQVTRLVLGDSGAARLRAAGDARTATQVGAATVLDGPGGRTVAGGPIALRRRLTPAAPATGLITPETQSAAQSCLGDAIAQTIIGSAVLGTRSALGVGLQDSADPPAGPKLLVCAAPHFRRDLGRIQRRLRTRFGGDDVPAARRAVIGEVDIGERDIVRAIVALDTVDAARLRDLLAGGRALRAIAGR